VDEWWPDGVIAIAGRPCPGCQPGQPAGPYGYLACPALPANPAGRPAVCRPWAERHDTWQLRMIGALWGFYEISRTVKEAARAASR
jgi:hypothetical protein